VFEFVKLAELYYAGSHGMDIRGPAKASRHAKAKVGTRPFPFPPHLVTTGRSTYLSLLSMCGSQAKRVLFQPASEFLPMIQQVGGFFFIWFSICRQIKRC
jgi:trehalose 6-phosphate phosphatase